MIGICAVADETIAVSCSTAPRLNLAVTTSYEIVMLKIVCTVTKFHYAILLANQLPSWFMRWSQTC